MVAPDAPEGPGVTTPNAPTPEAPDAPNPDTPTPNPPAMPARDGPDPPGRSDVASNVSRVFGGLGLLEGSEEGRDESLHNIRRQYSPR